MADNAPAAEASGPAGGPVPGLTDRSHYRHWVRDTIRYSDTDMVGHVNNLAFAAYCETGRTMFMHAFPQPLIGVHSQTVIARITINFLDEAHWPGEAEIGTGVIRVGNSSMTLGQGLFNEGRCFATSESTIVMIDRQTRRPSRIPDDFRDWLLSFRIG
jgi:acyl-CoA thioester hydrolase